MTSQETRGEKNTRPAFDSDSVQSAATPVRDTDPLPQQTDPVGFQEGMKRLRWRRKLFFAIIIAYMPVMWLSNKLFPSFKSMVITFGVWVLVLFITALFSAVARCPRCGNYFHMHGMSLMYLRRCLHCQLSIKAQRGED